jgi:ribosomal protein S12 methylthiotransferase
MAISSSNIKLLTLGCSKNTVDSEMLMRQLVANGYSLSDDSEETPIAVINTCGFIEAAKQESIDTILHAVSLKNEGKIKKIIVMGCLSERYARELKKEIPEVDAFIGANKIDDVVREVGGDYKYELVGERMLTTPRHYAYLKISEGCDRPCSFCSIPLMRGSHISKPLDRVLLEARRLAALGVKELILIAQDSTYYGMDLYGKRMLARVLEELQTVEGIDWIRLMYAFPTGFPMDVLEQFVSNPKLCHYLDMPVQHISEQVLSSMKRNISTGKLRDLIGSMRSKVPDLALRTTLIVGYPIEGEREFEELLKFVRETKFDRLGVFTYSHEEGTSAYPLGDPVPQDVKEQRRDAIMEIQREISRERNEKLVGTRQIVLIDEVVKGGAVGRTFRDAPEIDNEVIIHSSHDCKTGSFYNVEIVDAEEYDLFGIPANMNETVAIGVDESAE